MNNYDNDYRDSMLEAYDRGVAEAQDENGYSAGYRMGLIDGIVKYAHWKDGVQYVGTCGTTLKDALARILKEKI